MSDCGKFDLVTVRDGAGVDVLLFLRLCDGRFFGGNSLDRTGGFESGIHVMRTLGGMLDIIGQIANSPLEHRTLAYTLDGAHWTTRIGREMSATDIAKALSCEQGQVLDHFAPLVSLADSRGTEG